MAERSDIWAAFEGGAVRKRELRLSQGEADRLRRECPAAVLEELGGGRGDRTWYRVTLEGERLTP